MTEVETIEARAARWACGGNTGTSSKTLMAFMLGNEIADPSYPHDSSDFNRCMMLLDAVPEWVERLPEMGSLPGLDGAVWAALAVQWKDLTLKYGQEDGHKVVSEMIRAIRDPLEKESGEVVRLSPICTMRVRGGGAGKKDDMPMKPATSEKFEEFQKRSDPPGEGHNSPSGQRLKSFIERIERLEEEKRGLADDVKDVYAEAKGVGFDPKIIKKLVNLRKMSVEKRREEQELLETYANAIQMDLFP